ncbi:MAG: helix-turn-helix domain-containing protein [Fusobacterium sp.]|nr:helix-turn-helix domain-containing protein [Fusobacterium sp.]
MRFKNRISVAEASEILGLSQQSLRLFIREDKFEFAEAIKNKSKWIYYINKKGLENYIK